MTKDMLSQEEINLLLQGTEEEPEVQEEEYEHVEEEYEHVMDEIEKDTLGEIGNISMGTAATTLSTLLNRKVLITTPKVTVTSTKKLAYEHPIPFVAVDVKYKEGLQGSNILMVRTDDVKIITDIIMGKDEIDTERELTELDLSAISEVMNQMMGSASTSMSEILSKRIDIEPPHSYEVTVSEGRKTLDVLNTDDPIINISFKMVVEDLIDSELMQLIPLDFGQELADTLLGRSFTDVIDEPIEAEVKHEPKHREVSNKKPSMEGKVNNVQKEQVIVKKPEFETFDIEEDVSYNESIDLVGDIPVELTVELGRTIKKIGEILGYGPGTVIELDKLVGEPLNIYANGKYIAKGEVVVIDDNFGIRITDIDNSDVR